MRDEYSPDDVPLPGEAEVPGVLHHLGDAVHGDHYIWNTSLCRHFDTELWLTESYFG